VQIFNIKLNFANGLVLLQRNQPLDKFIFSPEKKFRRTSDYGKNNLLIPLSSCELDMHTALQIKMATITV